MVSIIIISSKVTLNLTPKEETMKRKILSDSGISPRLFLVSVLALTLLFGSMGTFAVGAEKVKIGSLMAMSGGLSKYGPPIKDGAQLAVKDLNEAGGVLGKEVELVVKDTATKPSVGRDAASKLVNIEGVPVIIGALSSGVTRTVSSVTSANQTVLISPSATSPAITNLADDDYTFRTAVPDKFQGEVLAQLASNLGYGAVSVIFVNNAYGKGLAGIFKENFEAVGGKVTAMVPYKQNLPSFGGEASKAVNPDPDAILVIGYPTGGNKLLQKIIELGYEGNYLFPDGMKGEGVAPGPTCSAEGPPSEQYIEAAFGTAPTSSTPAAEEFSAAYEAEFGPSAVPFKAQAYDATVVAALAIQYSGEASGPAMRDSLRKVANAPGEEVSFGELEKALRLAKEGKDINWQGVSGTVEFDSKGDSAPASVVVWGVQDCQTKNLWFVKV